MGRGLLGADQQGSTKGAAVLIGGFPQTISYNRTTGIQAPSSHHVYTKASWAEPSGVEDAGTKNQVLGFNQAPHHIIAQVQDQTQTLESALCAPRVFLQPECDFCPSDHGGF